MPRHDLDEQQLARAQAYHDLIVQYDKLPDHKMLALVGIRLVIARHSFDRMLRRLSMEDGVLYVAQRAAAAMDSTLGTLHRMLIDTRQEDAVAEIERLSAVLREPETSQFLVAVLQRLFDREAYLADKNR
jgi:hypothetical protein